MSRGRFDDAAYGGLGSYGYGGGFGGGFGGVDSDDEALGGYGSGYAAAYGGVFDNEALFGGLGDSDDDEGGALGGVSKRVLAARRRLRAATLAAKRPAAAGVIKRRPGSFQLAVKKYMKEHPNADLPKASRAALSPVDFRATSTPILPRP